jgi:hypothetical protein
VNETAQDISGFKKRPVMGSEKMQELVRLKLGLRIDPEMATYLERRLRKPNDSHEIYLMGGHARTGVPVRTRLSPEHLRLLTPPQSTDSLSP